MLETMLGFTTCGAIIDDNGEPTELYCNVDTGDVVFENSMDGALVLIGELSVDNTIAIKDLRSMKKALVENKWDEAIGVIMCEDKAIAIMTDSIAEVRNLATPHKHSSTTIKVDLNQEYELE